MTGRNQLIVVSNRLPLHRVKRGEKSYWERSPGGLVSAVEPVLKNLRSAWVGWAGIAGSAPRPFNHEGINIRPVRLRARELRSFYDGFCNRTLWPLYHDSVRTPEYRRRWWQPYVEVNQRFADAAAKVADENAIVWVHDYQLQLVPGMLRKMRPELRIGFFLHIPFPPQELFAQLPWREAVLHGLLGADVVGFQTRTGAHNFSQLARRFARARGSAEHVRVGDRMVQVGAFPISIDVDIYEQAARSPEVKRQAEQYRARLGGNRRILLGVDRMDYTKGIDIRMIAFREMLQQQRVKPDECVFVQVAVPSRERVEEYQELRESVERLVGEINGEFGQLGHTPVQYFHRSLPLNELVALYVIADVMIVTPHRDGMNLVAKEYAMSRCDETGVLVLSEFTGAAHELRSALLVNPHDIDGLVGTFEQALRMPRDEQRRRMRAMRREIRRHDVHHWANRFFAAICRGAPVGAGVE